jgi:hypothetical protein
MLLLTRWHIGRACVHVSSPCVDRVQPVIGPSAIECRYA